MQPPCSFGSKLRVDRDEPGGPNGRRDCWMKGTTMSIEFRPLSDALGAEVVGVDVSEDLSDETIAEIRTGWLQNNILLFRNQEMTRQQQKAFTQRFGTLMVSPNSRTRFPEHPEVLVFSNIKVDGEYIGSPPARVGEGWHSDFFYLKEPAGGSFFYAKEAPEKGGETWFANMTKAYEALSEEKKSTLSVRKCTYSQIKTLQRLVAAGFANPQPRAATNDRRAEARIAGRHPSHGARPPRDRAHGVVRRPARDAGVLRGRYERRGGCRVSGRVALICDATPIYLLAPMATRRRDFVG